jgi:Bacteriocin-protection, YdeI or OmpD-Associated/Domain of unknown function (DUF1905)
MHDMSDPSDAQGLRFRGVIEAASGGGAAVRVPPAVATALGGLKQMRVVGTIDGTEFRSSTMPYRGGLYMGVSKAMRAAAGVAIGDEIEVVATRDDSPRVVEVPAELEAVLSAEPELRARWDRLSFSHRREYADSIAEARRPDTRARRLEATLDHLRGLG